MGKGSYFEVGERGVWNDDVEDSEEGQFYQGEEEDEREEEGAGQEVQFAPLVDQRGTLPVPDGGQHQLHVRTRHKLKQLLTPPSQISNHKPCGT